MAIFEPPYWYISSCEKCAKYVPPKIDENLNLVQGYCKRKYDEKCPTIVYRLHKIENNELQSLGVKLDT